ncbi:MAG TPA: N-acetyl-gamma-glutamyl-phosphate reductase [Acidimicrobiales bacterium]|nr:N-acetyl-gamma-glutamyl-phosphate reductase [Acidimicrobiales bacterium]
MKAGVVGASGYAGAELLRLLAGHDEIDVVVVQAGSAAGVAVGELYPGLRSAYGDLPMGELDPASVDGLDVLFLALPSGETHRLVPDLVGRVGLIVDLGADFRLKDPALYEQWYGWEHSAPHLLSEFVYGLPEKERASLSGAKLVAAPGCYVTAATLALAPLVEAGLIERTGVIVDAASGVSGAGRKPAATTHFANVNEGFSAYGVLDHRHTPEIEQATGAQVLFTPHLAPMTRGILATCYARPATSGLTTAAVLGHLRDAYADEPFVAVVDEPPSTRDTLGANTCHITARFDERTGYVVVLSAIDNLVKGAAGQAIQAANVALGIAETMGLPLVAVVP